MSLDYNLLIIGPSDSGKTTMANILLGIDEQNDDQSLVHQVYIDNLCQILRGTLYGKKEQPLKIMELNLESVFDNQKIQNQNTFVQELQKVNKIIQEHFDVYVNKILVCLDVNRKFDQIALNFIKATEIFSPTKQKISIILTKCNKPLLKQRQQIINSWKDKLEEYGLEQVYQFEISVDKADQKFQISLKNSTKEKIRQMDKLVREELEIIMQIYPKELQNFDQNQTCFSLDMEISISDGSLKPFNQLINCNLLHKDEKNSQFLGFIHLDQQSLVEFIQFVTDDQEILECSESHLIYCHSKSDGRLIQNYIKAEQIEICDYLLSCKFDNQNRFIKNPIKVKQKNIIIKRGYWCPLTSSGSQIINSFVTSSYASVSEFVNQEFAHLAMQPLIKYRQIFGYQQNTNQTSIFSLYAKIGQWMFEKKKKNQRQEYQN